MKEKYTIGETAALLGVSTQTLRYYDKIGLLSPKYTDESNSYRYYCYNQFHYIDKIKYLQGFGLSLDEIKEIIQDGSVDNLLKYLAVKKQELIQQELDLQEKIKDINWYIDYFNYIDKSSVNKNVYKIQLPERYIIRVPCYYKESLANMEIRLAQAKAGKEYENLKFRRQYGYRLDFPSLLNGSFYPKDYFVFLSSKPDIDPKLYSVLPKGEYLCFRTQILHQQWDPALITEYFAGKTESRLALALEFEDNLDSWMDAWYEVQILL